jgi:hypothetical protein
MIDINTLAPLILQIQEFNQNQIKTNQLLENILQELKNQKK